MRKIILASASPRRKQILQSLIGNNFETKISSYEEENSVPDLDPLELVQYYSKQKALDVKRQLEHKSGIIISGDTVLLFGNKILDKPKSEDSARAILKILSGKYIEVISGITVIDVDYDKELTSYEKTQIRIKNMREEEIDKYIESGEPLDKAGAIGVQEKGGIFLEKIEGCYFNVVGLPIYLLNNLLEQLGVSIFEYTSLDTSEESQPYLSSENDLVESMKPTLIDSSSSFDFFISYSSEGGKSQGKNQRELYNETVEKFVNTLKNRGYRVWFDKERMKEAAKTEELMERGIKQSRHCIMIICDEYFDSQNTLFELETILKTKTAKNIFPVWWKGIDSKNLKSFPHGEDLVKILGIRWEEWNGEIDDLIPELLKRVWKSEGFGTYAGVNLVLAEVQLLKELESQFKESIPLLKTSYSKGKNPFLPKFGFYSENNQVTELYLENKFLKEMSLSLQQFGALKVLNLKRTQLERAPPPLSTLEILDLSQNRLKSLPEDLSRFSNLKLLDLSYNLLEVLPETFNQLKNLKELYLNNNRLKNLPMNFGDLENLEILKLNDNALYSLPDSFDKLTSLKLAYLYNNQIESLSVNFGNLKNLEQLFLQSNKLTSIPDSIGQLTKLKVLDLRWNQLSSKNLPNSFFELFQLQELYLGWNKFVELPEDFGKLINLKSLGLKSNELETLPEEIKQLKNLQKLEIPYNKLASLPENLGGLKQLQKLSAQKNQLTSLPKSFSDLTNLQTVYLDDNRLKALPDLSRLENIREFWLQNNRLTQLPTSINGLKEIIWLNLGMNELSSLPNTIGELKNLKELYLNDNKLNSDSILVNLKNLIQLTYLDLTGNALDSLPPSIEVLKKKGCIIAH